MHNGMLWFGNIFNKTFKMSVVFSHETQVVSSSCVESFNEIAMLVHDAVTSMQLELLQEETVPIDKTFLSIEVTDPTSI